MRARIKAITKGFRKEGVAPGAAAEAEDPNSLAYKVGSLLANSGHGKPLAEAFALITDLDILTPYNSTIARKNGAARAGNVVKFLKPLVSVVVLKGYNGHTYPLNVPLVVSSLPGYAYAAAGTVANSLANGLEGEVRLATDAEIDALTEAQLKAMIAEYS